MAYLDVKYYRSYVLEVRELGDTGWEVHVYAPRGDSVPRKIAITKSTVPSDLGKVMRDARNAVDADLAQHQVSGGALI